MDVLKALKEAQFTPGPWEIHDESNEYFRCCVIAPIPSRAMQAWRNQKLHEWASTETERELGSFGTTTICGNIGQKFNGSGPRHGPKIILDATEAEANAHLIGAGPGLIRVLCELIALAEHGDADLDEQNWHPLLEDAREQVRKALGLAP